MWPSTPRPVRHGSRSGIGKGCWRSVSPTTVEEAPTRTGQWTLRDRARLAAFDGVLALSSPPGGPTEVELEIRANCHSRGPLLFRGADAHAQAHGFEISAAVTTGTISSPRSPTIRPTSPSSISGSRLFHRRGPPGALTARSTCRVSPFGAVPVRRAALRPRTAGRRHGWHRLPLEGSGVGQQPVHRGDRRVAGGGTAMDPEVIARLLARNTDNDAVRALSPREPRYSLSWRRAGPTPPSASSS